MKLLGKFLITGADSTEPNPRTSFDTEEKALEKAKYFLTNNQDCQAAIIWKPHLIVKKAIPPFETISADDLILKIGETPSEYLEKTKQ